jgi:arylsulfatase A-like enzyme
MNKGVIFSILVGRLGLNSVQAAERPNVVVILTDDQGYADAGCYGSPNIRTPNLDRMAAEGIRFTSFYAPANICTPSRVGFLTGRYPARVGVNVAYFPDDEKGMPLSEITLADALKKQGYRTGYIGKWHLGHSPEYLPTARGFESFYGIPYSNDMGLNPGLTKPAATILLREGKSLEDYNRMDPKARWAVPPLMRGAHCIEWPADQDTLTQRYTEEAVSFIKQNRDKPFFLFIAPAAPHTPLHASKAFRGKSKRGLYGDAVEEIDWAVGELLDTLKAESLEKKTFVFFTSDNGPALYSGPENAGSAFPLRDGKCTTYEGGHRVPAIAWWPGTIPSGQVCDKITSGLDLFPTLVPLSGGEIPDDRKIDGNNILPLLMGQKDATGADEYVFGFSAVRIGDWKYRKGRLTSGPLSEKNPYVEQLFNLKNDIGETTNLLDQYPEKVQILSKKLRTFVNECPRSVSP